MKLKHFNWRDYVLYLAMHNINVTASNEVDAVYELLDMVTSWDSEFANKLVKAQEEYIKWHPKAT